MARASGHRSCFYRSIPPNLPTLALFIKKMAGPRGVDVILYDVTVLPLFLLVFLFEEDK